MTKHKLGEEAHAVVLKENFCAILPENFHFYSGNIYYKYTNYFCAENVMIENKITKIRGKN